MIMTGASVFVGGYLCPELLAEGWNVRAGVRSPEATGRLPHGVEPFSVSEIGPETDWGVV